MSEKEDEITDLLGDFVARKLVLMEEQLLAAEAKIAELEQKVNEN